VATRTVADEASGRLGLGGPWPRLQEILRRADVVRTSCPGPNDVLFRRRDDVEPWTPPTLLLASYAFHSRPEAFLQSL